MRLFLSIILVLLALQAEAQFYNWSVWRFDPGRSAASPEQLSDNLYLQWQVKYSPRIPVWDDPLNQNLMQFDNAELTLTTTLSGSTAKPSASFPGEVRESNGEF